MKIATEQIEAERGISHLEDEGDEELGMLGPQTRPNGIDDTSYHGATTAPYSYQDARTRR